MSDSAREANRHCEFSAPEGAYVRKEQKAHLSPKNEVFLRSTGTRSELQCDPIIQAQNEDCSRIDSVTPKN